MDAVARSAAGAAPPPTQLPVGPFGEVADLLPIICWQADGDGRLIAFNRRWHEYAGDAAADNAVVLAEAIRAAGEAETFSITIALSGSDGV